MGVGVAVGLLTRCAVGVGLEVIGGFAVGLEAIVDVVVSGLMMEGVAVGLRRTVEVAEATEAAVSVVGIEEGRTIWVIPIAMEVTVVAFIG